MIVWRNCLPWRNEGPVGMRWRDIQSRMQAAVSSRYQSKKSKNTFKGRLFWHFPISSWNEQMRKMAHLVSFEPSAREMKRLNGRAKRLFGDSSKERKCYRCGMETAHPFSRFVLR
jgi:hypothetical protein